MQYYIASLLSLVAILQCVLIYRLETGATWKAGIATQVVNPDGPSFIIPGQAADIERSRKLWEKVDADLRGAGIK